MEDKSISFKLYKLFIIGLKYIPFLIGVMYFIAVILGCFGIQTGVFAATVYMGFIPSMFWILVSFVFRCCIWHRLPIYYCWINNIISWIDFKWRIPFNNLEMILVYSAIAIVFILLGMYFKNKKNVERRVSKESVI